jgi:Domain of unknown function (DUF3402)
MLPDLQGLVVSLLQLLLGSCTASSIPTYADDCVKTAEEVEAAAVDCNRDKEIIAKAITGIIILLLKFFRISRISRQVAR